MDKYVIQIIEPTSGEYTEYNGQYVRLYDATTLVLETVSTKENAKTFDDAAEAMEYWRMQSKSVPFRPDGKPNRPLTAFSVEISLLK